MSITPKRRRQVGDRDGWKCSYCGTQLVPFGREQEFCGWLEAYTSWEHCGCGLHDLVTEPCEFSGAWVPPPGWDWPHVDHVIPRSQGGGSELSNLVLACVSCNSRKGSMSAERFRLRLELA